MGAFWGAALVALIIILMAVAVILGFALQRQTRESWKQQVRKASQAVLERPSTSGASATVEPRRVSFDQLWEEESEQGVAYWDVAADLADVVEVTSELRQQPVSDAARTIFVGATGDADAADTQNAASVSLAESAQNESMRRVVEFAESLPADIPPSADKVNPHHDTA